MRNEEEGPDPAPPHPQPLLLPWGPPHLLILHPDELFCLCVRCRQWQDGDGALHAAVLGQFAVG